MATTYKTLRTDDVVSTRSLLHEAIPLTGSIVSGTYSDENIKNYSHGMFQSVYDYPYLSSSANHIFDITVGYASNSNLSGTAARTQQDKRSISTRRCPRSLWGLITPDLYSSLMKTEIYQPAAPSLKNVYS